ncbi:nickel pincer cofactor biosynthesis protein LarB [Haloprofundus sp. MHR1]|uniref:nickel pincer cofactor biosynthesis protein LarB n=1 Tax=Haloprofundus sp. MHR1 TaxID=2572921 RepID=UPI0010BE8392|nr:nickel pincer cofactor biosynthesis protein LarB [Haloprofundus sp. MHR1]QCJ46984.1 nickel pincer cofactor biosynthesis protein LarB [Haloprofundus sp. MHR1]
MRDILESVAAGELSPATAEARLSGYASTDAGRFDAAREHRRGVPEAILADGKTPEETASLVLTALETTGRALVTRTDEADVAAVRARVDAEAPDATVETDERARTLVARAPDHERPSLDATVAVVTAGTSDAAAAGEATTVLREMGATVDRIDDVGVANIDRVLDQREALRAADVLVVAAGREGALPTVVAGMVDAPVIALPVAVGYGFGGDGDAALAGMLQSCSVLSVVNVDAGFVAGAQAGLIARAVSAARGA